jgi:hypothetical protein
MHKAMIGRLLLAAVIAGTLGAGPRLSGRRVEADPKKDYLLEKDCGPWMVMVTTFNARKPKEAQKFTYDEAKHDTYETAKLLALEVRRTFNIPAYVYPMQSHFGKDLPKVRRGRPTRTSYRINPSELREGLALSDAAQDHLTDMVTREESYIEPVDARVREFHQVAVLAGDYATVDQAHRMLERIKQWNPKTIQAMVSGMSEQVLLPKGAQGPLWQAFVTPNPYVPPKYLQAQEPDHLLLQMNQGRYNLYDCPGRYSVLVATFAGRTYVEYHKDKLDKFVNELETTDQDRLQRAAKDAIELTKALRAHHWEAYVFHDRNSSIVTVGSFASAEDPWFRKTIETFAAKPVGNPPEPRPERLGRWQFNHKPLPVKVPRRPR